MSRSVRCLCGLAVVVLLARPGAAQAPNPTAFQITVEDELGGVLVGAKVTLTAVATQQTSEGEADQKGRVSFENLAPGDYTLAAESPGFKKLERKITIGKGAPKPLKLQLKIDLSESVSVAEKKRPAPVFASTAQNADSIEVDKDMLTGAPLLASSDQLTEYLSNFLSPVVGSASIVMDGQEVSGIMLPPKGIQSLVVNKNAYSPEYRRPGRGRIEVVSQNGSKSHYHADGTLLFSDSAVASRSHFETVKPDLQQWLGQMDFGGAIHHWKGSFLISGSVLNDHTTGIVNALTPSGTFNALVPETQAEYSWRERLDVGPSDRVFLTFKFEQTRQHEIGGGTGGLALPELAHDTDEIGHAVRANAHTLISATVVNDTLATLEYREDALGGAAIEPYIVVNGAFRGGAFPGDQRSHSYRTEFNDVLTVFKGAHTLRLGGRYRPQFNTTTDRSNFAGTFQFASLDEYTAGRPYVFTVNQGDATIDYTHQVGEAFFQDEVRLRPDFSLMLGARYDVESELPDHNNLAPRFAFAYAPGAQKLNVRGGVGVFYDRLGETAVEQTRLYDGSRIQAIKITNPSYPNPFLSGVVTSGVTTRYQLAPDLSAPYLVQTSLSVEREVWRKTMLTLEYAHVEGKDLLRVRDLNAIAASPAAGPRATGNLNQIESTGKMRSDALYVTFRGRITGAFDGSAIYTYSDTKDNTPGAKAGGSLAFNLPANSADPDAEWGPADYDIRHRFTMNGLLELPGAFQIGSLLTLRSGLPYEVTTGLDGNGDGEATDRPAGGTRNSARGPGFARLDLRFTKLFKTGRPLKYPAAKPADLHLNVDAFNVFNRANFRNVVGALNSPLFGQPVSVYPPPRKIQFSVSYSF